MSEKPSSETTWERTVAKIIVYKTTTNLYPDKDDTGDVSFLVESQKIRAHRIILAALSPKYKAQFYGPQPDAGEIKVQGVTAAAFEEFLQFFYLHEVQLSKENIEEVLNLARQSLVDEFVDECVHFLIDILTVERLCWTYQLAIFYDLEFLRNRCESEISGKTKELFASESFKQCDHEILTRILKLDSFKCTEGEVFDACISWAQAACKEKYIDASKPANLRSALGDAIFSVRFASMTLEEFTSRHKAFEGFFTKDESDEITHIIAKSEDFQPKKFMPTLRDQTPYLECYRRRIRGLDEFEFGGMYTCGFQCDKPIHLHGFVIDGVNLTNESRVWMFKQPNSESIQERIMLVFSIKRSNKETIITFAKPIVLIPQRFHCFAIDFKIEKAIYF